MDEQAEYDFKTAEALFRSRRFMYVVFMCHLCIEKALKGMSFIYRTIERSDRAYSEWLHSKGFRDGNKSFKFFNFSNFYIPYRKFTGNRKMEVRSDNFTLHISMLSDKTIEHLIIGMFESGRMKIFDNVTDAEFSVKFIETVPEPEFKEIMKYKLISPAVFSKKVIIDGKEKIYFLDPSEDDYILYFYRNLLSKYKIYTGKEADELQDMFDMKVMSDPQKEIRTIKASGKYQTKIRGYKYEFELKAAPEIQRMIWMSGVGIKNSLGFGFVNSS
jgi:CRISPR-associated endoribonuclease Cas6